VDGQAACLVLDPAGKVSRAMLLNGTQLACGSYSLKGKGLRRVKVKQVDYGRGIVALAAPVLTEDLQPGQTVLVAPAAQADSVTLRAVLDPTHFSIGEEDLKVGGAPVAEIAGNRLISPIPIQNARAGMTVLSSSLRPVGRIIEGDHWTLDRTPQLSDFPPVGNGTRRFSVVILGAGDEVVLPDLVEYDR